MPRTLTKEEVFALPVDERLRLIGRLWDSITQQDLPLSERDARHIDDRMEEHHRDPDEGSSLAEIRNELGENHWQRRR